jgi:CheY-like chemotaxis protein
MKKVLVVEDDRSLRHMLCGMLETAGYQVTGSGDGLEALKLLRRRSFDLVLLDVRLPGINGLDVLAQLPAKKRRPKAIVMTSDDTPETVLRAVREQAYRYARKPISADQVITLVEEALSPRPETQEIEVISALPEWVELLVPCDLGAADRIHSFLQHLEADLSESVRDSVARAFRELLLNAIEWGGRMDPARKVRISYLRARRMLLYRIADPGPGFDLGNLPHAAVSNPADKPFEHMKARGEMGMRPGGFGLLLVRANVDELLYNEARNEVVFVKYLD